MNTKVDIHTKIPKEYKDMIERRFAEFDAWNPTDQRYVLHEVGIIKDRRALWREMLIFAIEEFCEKWDKQVKPGHLLYPLVKPLSTHVEFKKVSSQGTTRKDRLLLPEERQVRPA